jgi:hypothetical protein
VRAQGSDDSKCLDLQALLPAALYFIVGALEQMVEDDDQFVLSVFCLHTTP